MKGQLSAEMLILIAVVLAVVAIAGMTLMDSARDGQEQIENKTDELYKRTDSAMKGKEGDFCTLDDGSECLSGDCDMDTLECTKP